MKKYLLLITLALFSTSSFAQDSPQIANENFRKAIKAAGGESRLNTLKAPTMWMETGTYYGMGDDIPFVAQYASYWPKRWHRQLVEGKFAIGVAGKQVTMFLTGADGQKLSGEMADGTLHRTRVAWAPLLYPLLSKEYTLSNAAGVEVKGKPTVGVKATHKSSSELILYFDTSTFLLSKIEAEVASPEMSGKLVKNETYFSNHQSFGGVKLPSQYKTFYDGKLIAEGETQAIKTHATIDPAWFGAEGPARVR